MGTLATPANSIRSNTHWSANKPPPEIGKYLCSRKKIVYCAECQVPDSRHPFSLSRDPRNPQNTHLDSEKRKETLGFRSCVVGSVSLYRNRSTGFR